MSPPARPSHRQRNLQLVLTCEHAGNRVPRAYAGCFARAQDDLASHRGWDPGALALAGTIARRLGVPVLSVPWTRLLVEANRSPGHPRLWSRYTKALPAEEKQRIMERYWWPHRRAVLAALQHAMARGPVLHLAVHSFTPALDGEVRNADVGLLYDPARPAERTFCRQWAERLIAYPQTGRVRMNYPYRGASDGLTTWLRRQFPVHDYLGIELEANQRRTTGPDASTFRRALAESLAELIAAKSHAAVARTREQERGGHRR